MRPCSLLVEVGYTPVRAITVRGGFDYGWMKVDEDKRPSPGLEPALNWPVVVFTEDEDVFGADFVNQGFVSFGGGVRYTFNRTS